VTGPTFGAHTVSIHDLSQIPVPQYNHTPVHETVSADPPLPSKVRVHKNKSDS